MEQENQLGLAHLLEHMAFNGSKNFPKRKIDEYMSSIGLNIGSHYNASVGFLKTNYVYEIPTNNDEDVEVALKILTDISKNLSLEPEAFERERKIVEEEWRTDIGGSKNYINEFHKVMFKNSRFNERKPIGTLDIIQNFKYQDVIDYYKKEVRDITQKVITSDDTMRNLSTGSLNFTQKSTTAEDFLSLILDTFGNNEGLLISKYLLLSTSISIVGLE